jgi:tellurite resistance protein TehA-like permease
LFLFLIGVFTIYMVLAGNRVLTLKHKSKTEADWIDKSISGVMLIASLVMLVIGAYGTFQKIPNSVLYIFFGAFGLFMTIKDFKTFRTFKEDKNIWLRTHLGRMVGALIASVTAFLVAGLNIGTTIVWMTPTLLGTAYIIYWSRKYQTIKAVGQ